MSSFEIFRPDIEDEKRVKELQNNSYEYGVNSKNLKEAPSNPSGAKSFEKSQQEGKEKREVKKDETKNETNDFSKMKNKITSAEKAEKQAQGKLYEAALETDNWPLILDLGDDTNLATKANIGGTEGTKSLDKND